MLERARKGGYAIGAFNVYDVNGGAAVIGAAEACRSPAIVQARDRDVVVYPHPCTYRSHAH